MTSSLTPVLTSPGWELLQRWENHSERQSISSIDLGKALRSAGVSTDTVTGILTQLSLRDEAERKFGEFARHMIFTRDGLEQATRMIVAARHAQRFRDAGTTCIADLGCGIGGDALAFAGLGLKVIAIDRDEDAANATAVNLRAFDDSDVRLADVTELSIPDLVTEGVDGLFADPARRTGASHGSARRLSPHQWSPPLPTILSWRDYCEALGVKLAPGIGHSHLPADCHVQWTSVDGDLVEAALWTPPLAPEGAGRSALVFHGTTAHLLSDEDVHAANAPIRQAEVQPLGQMIAEPDPAVIRSGMVAQLADTLGAGLVSPSIAYLTGDDLPKTPFATRFEVLDTTALRPKAINAALKALNIGRIEVKKRGADIQPATFRKSLKLLGEEEATLFATRIQGRHKAVIARRVV
ncbi:MAG: SAM-dependent methyltransferase [Actinobacteria bacterium]|nr:MAG: SAM-dependent methyltransferase [Actinomycetota bacterium]